MKIFSAFDGISCGRLALERAEIPVDSYHTSEVDKYATAVSSYHYPDTTRLGDINSIQDYKGQVDLLLAGFPCQSFSVAGNRLNFDDPRGQLFFELMRLKDLLKPKWFLFENVRMKPHVQEAISNIIGVEPILINSALLSAQNRERLYWTNIPVTPPELCAELAEYCYQKLK